MAEILFYAGIPLAFAAAVLAVIGLRQPTQVLHRGPVLVALLCLVLGLAVTVHYVDLARQRAHDEARTRFLHDAELLEADVQNQIGELEHVLNGVRGLFLASEDVSRAEFKRFFDSRDLHLEYPGFRGLGFVERVPRPLLPAFMARMRQEWGPRFQVQTLGQQPDLFVVKYLEPVRSNGPALGYDIGSEPLRRGAAEAAMRSGMAALTPRIRLVQDPLQRAAFLFLLPVYANGSIPEARAERERSLRGWVYAPVVLAELMASGQGFDTGMVNFQLFDQPELNARSLVYDSQLPAGEVQSPASLERQTHSLFSVVRPILLADQVFYLRTNSAPAFEAGYHPHEHLKAALLGSGLSVLAAMVLWLLMAGRARALDLAQRMTHDLDRLAMVARRTSNAVYFADTEWRITWINEGFTRMSGFSADEAVGLRPSQLLHSPHAAADMADTIDRKVAEDNRVQIHVLQRSKSGQDYWVDLEVMPIRDRQDRITGYLSVQSDITEEVQAKAALVLEKERADNILTGTNVGTWESNLQTGEYSWNARWSAMMGFERDEVQPSLAQFWQRRLHPADRLRMHRAMVECVSGRSENLSCDVRVMRKDGSWMWILSRAKVMSRGADGRAVWIGGIHTDITEIKQVELNLRDMETFLDRAGRIAGVGAWQFDLKTRHITFSAQTCAIHGMGPDFQPALEVALSFYPEPDRQRVRQAMQRAEKEGVSWDLVVEFHNAQGEPLWVRIFCEVGFDDGGPVRLMGAFQDVTENQLAQREVELTSAQLAQTTATLQNVLDSATAVGVVTLGLDHGIRVFNKGAENLLGFAASEIGQGHNASAFFDKAELGLLRETQELVLGHAPDWAEVFDQVVQTREQQQWTLVRQNGSRFKASLIFSPMCDAQGTLQGHLAVIYDISKQSEYESSLREAMRLAEQSSVAKSQFLANMSHEIRTPMNAILGMLELLRNTALNTQQHDYTEKAVGAARSLLELLNDILDFSKVEAGKMQLDPEPFVLEELLGDLSVILSSNLGARDVDLVFDVDPAIPRELIGDAMRLKQILINLGGNAVKFTDHGEVVIRWTLLARSSEQIKLAVAVVDTGIGIAPENQARIFDAFTQAEANTTRRFGGTGLGLVISTRLIHLMGGELHLSSVLGQGSTFSFTLELQAAGFDTAPSLPATSPPAVQPPPRVMLVDDNAHARSSSTNMMRGLGWTVHSAACGPDALDGLRTALATQATPLDAIFVDADMPGMDGWETLRKVCRLYGSRPLPLLILLSRQSRGGLAQRTEREQELLSALMVKPLTATMFAQALAQARSGTSLLGTPARTRLQRLAGMRVLLVEDNLINQQVAQELLQAQGARVTLADNGALGLDAVRVAQPGFDVVLMDLQMPVMDGLSATRALRADPRFATLPVIAMTANAMHSDREACLAVGMNDHIGKPFDLNQLVQALLTHTGWVGQAAGSAQPAQAGQGAEASWPEGMDIPVALARMGGNRQLLQRSISAFVADARQLPQRLRQADAEQRRRELHGFKGLSATIGASALSALAARAEKLALAVHAEADGVRALQQFTEQLAQQLPVLEAVAGRLQAGVPPAPAPALASTAAPSSAVAAELAPSLEPLRALWRALQHSDMGAMELHARLRQGQASSLEASMQALDQAMAELDFERAASACALLLRPFDTREPPALP